MKIYSNSLPAKHIACIIIFSALSITLINCKSREKESSVEMITDNGQQTSIFENLVQLTNTVIPKNVQDDSLAFLILPVEVSCPACRNKTIDSIVQHKENLPDNHFIIISADGGQKTIKGYFKENDKEMPGIDKLFLDSTNLAHKLRLYENKPTMYYATKGKVYKKVAAIPRTVREDLREFFSGYRRKL